MKMCYSYNRVGVYKVEEIDVVRLLDYFKHKVWSILFITICVGTLFFTYQAFFKVPLYRSYTTVILGGSSEKENTSLTQSDVILNKNLVDTYAEVVKSRRVLEQVISNLALDMSYEQLERTISVTSLNDTEIIKIVVTSLDSEQAKKVADTTASYFTKEITRLYNLNNVNVLDQAVPAKKPFNINYKKMLLISFVIGFVVAFGIIFIVYYFDRTIKSVEMVEEITGLPILGTIQESRKKGRKEHER